MPLEPIPPPDEATGQSHLPLSRVKRIISTDIDVDKCSNNAAFVISVATEMFVQYFAEQGHTVVKAERKPRRNIQYKDLATAVSRVDDLEFLSGVVPRTVQYKQYKEKKAKEKEAQEQMRPLRVVVNREPGTEGMKLNGLPLRSGQTFSPTKEMEEDGDKAPDVTDKS